MGCGGSGCCRIGTEHEKLGFDLNTNARMTYEQIEKVLRRLESRFGWKPIIEAGKIIGVTYDGQSVTLEPGGQFELSGAPVDTIHRTCAEVNSHLYQVNINLMPLDLKLLHCRRLSSCT
jgi:glutamate--cysteine ligase